MSKKFKLDPNPTFDAAVQVPVHGKGTESVRFTFKHMTKDELAEVSASAKDMTEVESIKAVTVGWELEDEFNDENILRLIQNYQGAGKAIISTYLDEIRQARMGN
jgi:hypothetical protein